MPLLSNIMETITIPPQQLLLPLPYSTTTVLLLHSFRFPMSHSMSCVALTSTTCVHVIQGPVPGAGTPQPPGPALCVFDRVPGGTGSQNQPCPAAVQQKQTVNLPHPLRRGKMVLNQMSGITIIPTFCTSRQRMYLLGFSHPPPPLSPPPETS